MSYKDNNDAIRKGQAINLSILSAGFNAVVNSNIFAASVRDSNGSEIEITNKYNRYTELFNKLQGNTLRDNEYIVKHFLKHMQFSALKQKATPEQLAIAVENPSFLELIQKLDAELK